jgi:hypothetical protein
MPLRTMKRVVWAACVLAGCASGRSAPDNIDAEVGPAADAKVYLDGNIEGHPDAKLVDAQTVIPPDAPYVCQPHTQQMLINPVLDLNPSGMGWVQQNIDNAYPIITGDDGVPEQSPPYKAWMGGLAGEDYFVSTLTDQLYQDVAIPMGTTQLVLTGYYDVRTAEITSSVYDSAQVALTQTNGTPIETALQLSNLTPTTAWTPMNKTFANATALSGQTVRLRIVTTNDVTDATSFYFDTLALSATICQ